MPLYEYECENGHHHERVKSIPERRDEDCPDCKGTVRIVMSAPRKAKEAHYFSTYDSEGRLIGRSQTTERTSYRLGEE